MKLPPRKLYICNKEWSVTFKPVVLDDDDNATKGTTEKSSTPVSYLPPTPTARRKRSVYKVMKPLYTQCIEILVISGIGNF